jgi:hypothetical protein
VHTVVVSVKPNSNKPFTYTDFLLLNAYDGSSKVMRYSGRLLHNHMRHSPGASENLQLSIFSVLYFVKYFTISIIYLCTHFMPLLRFVTVTLSLPSFTKTCYSRSVPHCSHMRMSQFQWSRVQCANGAPICLYRKYST